MTTTLEDVWDVLANPPPPRDQACRMALYDVAGNVLLVVAANYDDDDYPKVTVYLEGDFIEWT